MERLRKIMLAEIAKCHWGGLNNEKSAISGLMKLVIFSFAE
jgi:hypothetical protein